MIGAAVDEGRIRTLVPHAGDMCLLHQVTRWDKTSITCLALSHCDPANPLRREGALAALHLIEYCAQAMAVHRGLVAESEGERMPRGWLVAVRDFRLQVERLDQLPSPLTVEARELLFFDGGTQYEVRAEAGGATVGSGRISVVKAPQ